MVSISPPNPFDNPGSTPCAEDRDIEYVVKQNPLVPPALRNAAPGHAQTYDAEASRAAEYSTYQASVRAANAKHEQQRVADTRPNTARKASVSTGNVNFKPKKG